MLSWSRKDEMGLPRQGLGHIYTHAPQWIDSGTVLVATVVLIRYFTMAWDEVPKVNEHQLHTIAP